jgi:D-alanyl-D-alanine carboxypeptidase (penicillin-binding protein 5/6)
MYPASMTKILTALLALEYLPPKALVVTGEEINAIPPDSSRSYHVAGETLVVENLIRGLIIPSGNETACVVAKAVAKQYKNLGEEDLAYPEAEALFSQLMNARAAELGAEDSNFVNPHGYQDQDHYSTAYDIARIARAGMQNELIRQIAREKEFTGDGAGGLAGGDAKTREYDWKTHNNLIADGEYAYPDATGIKTGWTDEAGYCVAASASKDGLDLIAVVMGSTETGRWRDAAVMLDYGFERYANYTLQEAGQPVLSMPVAERRRDMPEEVDLVAEETFAVFLAKEDYEALTYSLTLDEKTAAKQEGEWRSILAPTVEGQILGTIAYRVGDRVLYEGTLLAGGDVARRTLLSELEYYLQAPLDLFLSSKALYAVGGAVVGSILTLLLTRMAANRRRRRRWR